MLNVTAKLCDRNFGAKVQICFPRGEDYDVLAAELKRCLAKHAERIEALLVSGELESVFTSHGVNDGDPERKEKRIDPALSEKKSRDA